MASQLQGWDIDNPPVTSYSHLNDVLQPDSPTTSINGQSTMNDGANALWSISEGRDSDDTAGSDNRASFQPQEDKVQFQPYAIPKVIGRFPAKLLSPEELEIAQKNSSDTLLSTPRSKGLPLRSKTKINVPAPLIQIPTPEPSHIGSIENSPVAPIPPVPAKDDILPPRGAPSYTQQHQYQSPSLSTEAPDLEDFPLPPSVPELDQAQIFIRPRHNSGYAVRTSSLEPRANPIVTSTGEADYQHDRFSNQSLGGLRSRAPVNRYESDDEYSSGDNQWGYAGHPPPHQASALKSTNRRMIGQPIVRPNEREERQLLSPGVRNGQSQNPLETAHPNGDSYSDDLSNWAPTNQVPGHSTLPHLPDWHPEAPRSGTGNNLSSLPISLIQRDMDFTMRRLMNEKVLMTLLTNPLGRHRFREFMSDPSELDLWYDSSQSWRMMEELRANAEALHDIYLANGSDFTVSLPPEVRRDLLSSLRNLVSVDASFDSTQRHLLSKLYNNQFQDFVKHKIIEGVQVKLGKHNLAEQEQEGLGDCFCLTDPRLPDHPIVLVSEGFAGVTGYQKSQIVGRNCRFLQGPGTAPESVQRIRDGLNSGEGCTELLLNYRRNGEPFYCLLCILPLRDASGAVAYYIGGQINVTGILSSYKDIGFLIGGESSNSLHETVGAPLSETNTFSPIMTMYKQGQAANMSDIRSTKSGKNNTRSAAGAVEPSRTNSGTATSPKMSRAGIMNRFFNRSTTSGQSLDTQKLLPSGAETMMDGGMKPMEKQLTLFRDTYSKLIIFKAATREITFVTPNMLKFLGLPNSSPSDIFASPLIHRDIATLLTAADKVEAKQLRADFKDAIRNNMAISIMCGMKDFGKTKAFGRNEFSNPIFGIMHVTPLTNRDGASVAFVAVFG